MSKHIPIDNCTSCPHHYHQTKFGEPMDRNHVTDTPYCREVGKEIPHILDEDKDIAIAIVYKIEEIPEWCPLKDFNPPLGERPDALCGPSYEIKMDNDVTVQININELEDGTPFEVFIQNRGPVVFEWITAVTILVTTLLRSGYPLKQIGMELEEIPGPESGHIIPGTDIQSPSFISRVGRVLRIHAENKEKQK